MKTRNQGFSAITVLIVLLVVGVLIATGIVVASRSSNAKTASDNSKTSMNQAETEPPTKDTSSTTKYMTIKELGIKIPLSDTLQDITYYYEAVDNGYGGTDSVAYLKSSRFTNAVYACNGEVADPQTPSNATFAAISKSQGTIPDTEEAKATAIKQFNGFYVSIDYPNFLSCASDDQAASKKLQEIKKELQTAAYTAAKSAEIL